MPCAVRVHRSFIPTCLAMPFLFRCPVARQIFTAYTAYTRTVEASFFFFLFFVFAYPRGWIGYSSRQDHACIHGQAHGRWGVENIFIDASLSFLTSSLYIFYTRLWWWGPRGQGLTLIFMHVTTSLKPLEIIHSCKRVLGSGRYRHCAHYCLEILHKRPYQLY